MPSDTVPRPASASTGDPLHVLPLVFQHEGIPPSQAASLRPYYAQLLEDLLALRERCGERAPVVGICGAQGSGKTLLARVLQRALQEAGLAVAVLSLDDLYLSSAERARLAAQVHPLLRTRGVPGTHDVRLGVQLIERLRQAPGDARTPLPRFDKLADEPCPADQFEIFTGRADLVLFEGWCVGAHPQPPEALLPPLNALERELDADGRWRGYVNGQLQGPYRELFGMLDRLILLRAPGFDVVFRWRREQEHRLAARAGAGGISPAGPGEAPALAPGMPRIMSDAQLERFIMHYERLSRHILEEMPGRADVIIGLDGQRRILSLQRR